MDLPQKVRAPNPWALFGYFLSQQKVTPRRGGETRQKISKTRQECEGPDWRVAVKGNGTINNRSPYPGPRGRHVQEAALRACLEGQTDKTASAWRSPRVGVGQSRSGRGLSLREYKGYWAGRFVPFTAPCFYPRPMWKDAASSRGVSPAAADDQALSALDPDRTDVR